MRIIKEKEQNKSDEIQKDNDEGEQVAQEGNVISEDKETSEVIMMDYGITMHDYLSLICIRVFMITTFTNYLLELAQMVKIGILSKPNFNFVFYSRILIQCLSFG